MLSQAAYDFFFQVNKAIVINNKVKQLCNQINIIFIDTRLDIIGSKVMYSRNGLHLGYIGSKYHAFFISEHTGINK